MNRRPMKLHKGVDNILKFRVFSPDRVPVKICGYELYARLTYIDDRAIVIERKCTLGTATGMVFLEITEGDMADINVGVYELTITGAMPLIAGNREGEIMSTPFFTDFDSNIENTVIVTDQGDKQPFPSHIINESDWTDTVETPGGIVTSSKYSSAIPGNRVRNHSNGMHTYSLWAEALTGTLELYGTLEESPNAGLERGWFRIYPDSMSEEITFTNFTGTEAFSFQANYMWLKFKFTPSTDVEDPGHLKKILVRS